jgi:hypothetical protein
VRRLFDDIRVELKAELQMLKKAVPGFLLILVLCLLYIPVNSWADDLIVYPSKNQSAQQQDKDKWECRAWATKQTGF